MHTPSKTSAASPLQAATRNWLLPAALLLSLPTGPSARANGLVETFTYSDGNLTNLSGGQWQFWEPGAGDAAIVGNAMRFQGTTDVIRTFPAVLTAPGQTATISFTINVNIADSTEGYAMDFLPASAPFAEPGGTNYFNQFSLGFDYQSRYAQGNPLPDDDFASIDIATGTGAGTAVTRLGSIMSENVAHLIRVDLVRGVADTAYSLFMDGGLLNQGTFVLTDARGMNAVELEQSGEQTPSATAIATVDDLRIVPEPASASLVIVGCASLLGFRRGSRR